MHISRRSLIKGGLGLVVGLSLPILHIRPTLTDADRTLFAVLEPFHISQVKVHRLLRERMSLDRILGVKTEVFDEAPNENGYITYYNVVYGPGTARQSGSYGAGCSLPPNRMDEWIQRRGGWVPRNFAGRVVGS